MLAPSPVFTASSAVTTSATVAATLTTGTGDSFWYVSGFELAFGGATAGSIVNATLSGLLGGTITYPIAVPTGVTTGAFIPVEFPVALIQAAIATPVVLTLPALGAGNTAASVALHGFRSARQFT